MGLRDLPLTVLQHQRARAVENPQIAALKTGGMLSQACTAAPCLDADQPHPGVVEECGKEAYGVAAAAYAGYREIRRFGARRTLELASSLLAYHAMEVANQDRKSVV